MTLFQWCVDVEDDGGALAMIEEEESVELLMEVVAHDRSRESPKLLRMWMDKVGELLDPNGWQWRNSGGRRRSPSSDRARSF